MIETKLTNMRPKINPTPVTTSTKYKLDDGQPSISNYFPARNLTKPITIDNSWQNRVIFGVLKFFLFRKKNINVSKRFIVKMVQPRCLRHILSLSTANISRSLTGFCLNLRISDSFLRLSHFLFCKFG